MTIRHIQYARHQLPIRTRKRHPQQSGNQRRDIGLTKLINNATIANTRATSDKTSIHFRDIGIIPMMTSMRGDEHTLQRVLLDLRAGTVVDCTACLNRTTKNKSWNRGQCKDRPTIGT